MSKVATYSASSKVIASKMARQRRERPNKDGPVKLKQPDRSGPSEKTLLEIATEKGLFEEAKRKQAANDRAAGKLVKVRDDSESEDEDDEEEKMSPTAERFLEMLLYTVSLSMLHFTLDVLVQHQYAIDSVQWHSVVLRALQAFFGESALPVLALVFPHVERIV